MAVDNTVQNVGMASDTQIRAVLRRHIQRAYDRRLFNRTSLAKESEVNVHTIDQIVSRDPAKHRRIAAEDAFNLAYTLGDDAVTALNGVIHYTATRIEADCVSPAEIVSRLLPHLSTIATATSDGRIDHTEQDACTEAADHIIATLLPLSSSAKRG